MEAWTAMVDYQSGNARTQKMLSPKLILGTTAVVAILALAGWSLHSRFVRGIHPLSWLVMPTAPPGERKVNLWERVDQTSIWLRRASAETASELRDPTQNRRVREALRCRLGFVEDLDERGRFEAKKRDWVEIWQWGRIVCRGYFGGFVELPASDGGWLLYRGCPELYPLLRREASLAATEPGAGGGAQEAP